MSNSQKATGKKHAKAKDHLATIGDVDELFTIRLAQFYEAHVYEIRQWANWKSLPWYKRLWLTIWWGLKKRWKREGTGEDR